MSILHLGMVFAPLLLDAPMESAGDLRLQTRIIEIVLSHVGQIFEV